MKSNFSNSWKSSKQPRKQRKYRYNAPLHTRHKFLSAHLSKDLRKKYSKRSLPLRTGDEVLVMRGSFSKKKAKVASLELKRTRAVLEGLNRTKKDGTKVNVYFNPSNLQIQTLNLEDKERIKKLKVSEETPKTKENVSEESKNK